MILIFIIFISKIIAQERERARARAAAPKVRREGTVHTFLTI